MSVDGRRVTDLGVKIDPDTQKVAVDGQLVHSERAVYWAVHKPVGYLCTNHDPSGRPLAVLEGDFPTDAVADLDAGLCEEFLRAVASTAKLTLHVTVERAGNDHHAIESAFKAFARALRAAVALDPNESGVPSTKGLL